MRELTIISGKGGTGKTTLAAACAALAQDAFLIDCDVETPDLHLLLQPEQHETNEFVGGKVARLHWDQCLGCGRCAELCRFDAIITGGPPNRFAESTVAINANACEGCGLCAHICPTQAIEMWPATDGTWYRSTTRFGPLIHARLKPGRGNSGKLVSLLRTEARTSAANAGHKLLLSDGVPSIGCSTSATIRGASLALAVAEPSIAGLHDFVRVAELARHLSVPIILCVNRFDIDTELTERIEARAADLNIPSVGRIPDYRGIIAAQINGQTLIEADPGLAADAVREIWLRVQQHLAEQPDQTTTPTVPAHQE